MDKEKLPIVSAIALNTIFGYEPKFSHNIIEALGSAEAVFSLTDAELLKVFGPYNKYLAQINGGALRAAEEEYDRLSSLGYQVLSLFDEAYPSALRECPDAPMILYIRSTTPASELFNRRQVISIVGTRDISLYGKEWCRRIVDAISQAPGKPVIASGLAYGVDITAHLSALDCGLPTIGVSPVGIDRIYPTRHAQAAARIASAPGSAIITDYPPGTAPQVYNFLRRNRIIAGLGSSTLLIESKVKGGGMMTARLAAGYGRDVFALPGRIDDIRSQGCNLLLKEKIAEPISDLEALPSLLGLGQYNLRKKGSLDTMIKERFSDSLDSQGLADISSIASAIRKERGIDIEGLCRQCDLGFGEVSAYVGMLESEGIICIDLFQRCSINVKNA